MTKSRPKLTQTSEKNLHSFAVGTFSWSPADMQTDSLTDDQPDLHDAAMAAMARSVADHLGPAHGRAAQGRARARRRRRVHDRGGWADHPALAGALKAWRASGVGPRTVKLSPRDFGYRLGDLRDYVRAAERFFPAAAEPAGS